MNELSHFPLRMVHLDFHTSPAILDVGEDFDADAFAQTFVDAHVDSVTVFAKCHHGHLYYNTDRAERHPGLRPNFDLLRAQIDALHAKGIAAPIYISVQVDEYAANTHPEWIALDEKGTVAKAGGPLKAGWHTIDMSSPYQDFLADQIAEVLDKFAPVDGLFLDMCWDQVSVTPYAMQKMTAQGFDPTVEADRNTYARQVAYDYMARFKTMMDEAQQKAGGEPVGIWFNSRPKTNLNIEKRYLRHVEVECLPTGGWGYSYFPYVARYVRPFGFPTLSHTGRFHTSWGDFGGIKPRAAMKYETCSILSLGITNGIGDQLPPRGVLDKAAYELIGEAYAHIEKCEPFVLGGQLLSDVAVIIDPERGDSPGNCGLGTIRALQQLRQQFDLLPPGTDFSSYKCVIVPETTPVDDTLTAQLRAYASDGGALLLVGDAAFDESGQPRLSEQGAIGHGASPFTATYLRPAKEVGDSFPHTDSVMYLRGWRMTPTNNATSLCAVVEPYFERSYEHFCSHLQTPPSELSLYSAAIQHQNIITLAHPVFTAYGEYGNLPYRQLLKACLDRLLPEPLLRDGGPSFLEATVLQKDATTVVHLLSFLPSRRTEKLDIIEDALPLLEMPLSVRVDAGAPTKATLQPHNISLPLRVEDGRAHVEVTLRDGHGLVVLE